MNEEETIKVVLLGESGVGKTSIISQFTTNKFDPAQESSKSAQNVCKIIKFPDLGTSINFDIWDTTGNENYRLFAKIFYNDANVIILVYDITKEKSLEEIKSFWYKEIKSNSNKNPIFAVVANKSDFYEYESAIDEGKEFADKIGAIFQIISVPLNFGISKLFENIGKAILIPGYDYKTEYIKGKEEYDKKKQQMEDENKEDKFYLFSLSKFLSL